MKYKFLRTGKFVRAKGKTMTLYSYNVRSNTWAGEWKDESGQERLSIIGTEEIEAVQTSDGFRSILPELML